ncbi:MAG: hypothetical protein IJZ29_05355 [Clostridia bacterium]|nr:hypothetical protein [Clostridia bacterium]
MITVIAGKPGVGKTALLTYFAICDMTINAFSAVNQANNFIALLNIGGYKFSFAKNHLVYSNYDIKSHMKGYVPRRSYDMEGYEFGLPDSEHEAKLVYPYSSLFFTESQAFLNSRKSKLFRDSVSRAYEQHRHWDLNIYLDAQRATLIDLNVRELSTLIYVDELKYKKDKLGRIVKTLWHCSVFYDIKDYEEFERLSKKYNCENVTYIYDGNIHKCYDSKMNRLLFLDCSKHKDFYAEEYKDIDLKYESIQEFCNKKTLENMASKSYWSK